MEAVMITDMGKMLKKLMVDENISQNQLALDLGVSPSILSNYITDKNVPEVEVIGKLIERFKLEREDLKEILSKTLASTARHNYKISIDTRFFRPERVDILVKIITVLLMYQHGSRIQGYDANIIHVMVNHGNEKSRMNGEGYKHS
jgi:predicted transcriptional regulator